MVGDDTGGTMTDQNPPRMPRSGMPMEAVIGITVILAAVAVALFVALPTHQEEIPATWIEGATYVEGAQVHYGLMQDCGSALAPTGACPDLIHGKQFLAGGIAALGVLLGTGLIIAGYQARRQRRLPPAAPTGYTPTI
jgi:hypothetical protein